MGPGHQPAAGLPDSGSFPCAVPSAKQPCCGWQRKQANPDNQGEYRTATDPWRSQKKPGVVHTPVIPAMGRPKQEGHKFKPA